MLADALPKHQLCYMGSLNRIDGIKIAWIEQWKHLCPRGWAIRYITSESPGAWLPQMLDELTKWGLELRAVTAPQTPAEVTMDIANNFAELMFETLATYDFDIDAAAAAAAHHPPGMQPIVQWLVDYWRVLVEPFRGCEVVVHAAGDAADRLIVEAARLAGVKSVVGELSSLSIKPFALGSPSLYVGPSSFAVNTLHALYTDTAAEGNGALTHIVDLPAWMRFNGSTAACDTSVAVGPDGSVQEYCDGKVEYGDYGRHRAETEAEFAQRTTVIHLGANATHFSLQHPDITRARCAYLIFSSNWLSVV